MEDIDHDALASRRSPPPAHPPSAPPHAASPSLSHVPPSVSASSSGFAAIPATNPFRRSVTTDDVSPLRRRPISMTSFLSSDAGDTPARDVRRRSSTLSDFSMTDARRAFRDGTQDILNPSAAKHRASAQDHSSISSNFPLAVALLPALAGVLFEGGGAIITDMMLLGLVFIFLRYTITQPWQWYHEAQEVRIREEVGLEVSSEEEGEEDIPPKMSVPGAALDEVPEEDSDGGEDDGQKSQESSRHHGQRKPKQHVEHQHRTRAQQAAVDELYVHEVLALLACFLGPMLGAYLLHAIRAHLTRPSEGLMTDFNITVFLLAAELRPMSHALKLIQARTLHLQRIVQSLPMATRSTTLQLEEMRIRLAQLELRAEATAEITATALASATKANTAQEQQNSASSGRKKDATVREVRNAIQPDIDAVTRAVRRYEKKVTIMAVQTAAQLNTMDTRLDDAIALAAAAAKQNNQSQWSVVSLAAWVMDWLVRIVTMPFQLLMYSIVWPFKTVGRMCFQGRRRSSRDARDLSGRSSRHSGFRGSRNGSGSDRDRYKDRLPSRLSERYSP
ncbi:unnamed protein product [Discula destructiva]